MRVNVARRRGFDHRVTGQRGVGCSSTYPKIFGVGILARIRSSSSTVTR
jgi:hypothetical protein